MVSIDSAEAARSDSAGGGGGQVGSRAAEEASRQHAVTLEAQMVSKYMQAKAQHAEATARYQRALRHGTTEGAMDALDAQDAAYAELAQASLGRLTELQRAAKKCAEAA